MIAGLVVAVVVVVLAAGSLLLTSSSDSSSATGEAAEAGADPDQPERSPGVNPSESPAQGADPGNGGQETGAPAESADPSETEAAEAYTVVHDRVPLTLRAPAQRTYTHVEPDDATITPNEGNYLVGGVEFLYGNWNPAVAGLEFLTPTGLAREPGPESCRTGQRTDVLPGPVLMADLAEGDPVGSGTLLCTVTTEGDLAMLEVTGISDEELPEITAELTLWDIS
ncbi:hypothetical protein [Streptomyces sp. YIM 98790]|uniref:hypothetical protein n=1 Tax=Streptomyces sp. YIM 98790 TaxID=2689077 RepID=UPI00140D605B|nr:hypothetical protein [Streptomyces sp. YIM 98790]